MEIVVKAYLKYFALCEGDTELARHSDLAGAMVMCAAERVKRQAVKVR